ncbi:MAG: hypothetical protein Q9P44_15200 [Anaerolineae bacterium]|nr:hypothetical protein [Anaerolineae bacterium]
MNPQVQRDLSDIRKAAQERNQEQLQFMLKRLLQSLTFFTALSVPLEGLYHFLETFEQYYPDEEWVRKLVIAIGAYGTPPDDSIAEMALHQRFTAPGMGNYLKAVYDVTQAMQEKHTSEARISFMASAVVNTIMAQLAEAWYGKYPTAWDKVQQSKRNPETGAYTDPKATTIAYTFWMADDTAQRDTALWLSIADTIEAKFKRLERVDS